MTFVCFSMPLFCMEETKQPMAMKKRILQRASTASESSSEERSKSDAPVTPVVIKSPAIVSLMEKSKTDLMTQVNPQELKNTCAKIAVRHNPPSRAELLGHFVGSLNQACKRVKTTKTSITDLTNKETQLELSISSLKNEYEQLQAAIAMLKTESLPASLESEVKKALQEQVESLTKEKAYLAEMLKVFATNLSKVQTDQELEKGTK